MRLKDAVLHPWKYLIASLIRVSYGGRKHTPPLRNRKTMILILITQSSKVQSDASAHISLEGPHFDKTNFSTLGANCFLFPCTLWQWLPTLQQRLTFPGMEGCIPHASEWLGSTGFHPGDGF